MHGRPRKATKPEDEAISNAKATKLRSLQSQFLHNHHHKLYDKEAMEVSFKLLEINPECYTAWNYRRLGVEYSLSQLGLDPQSVLDEELKVVEIALKQNFKSYGAWHHRKWVLSKGHSSVDHELRLLDKFQKADARNFHAWNYRRFVAGLKNISEQDELKYTTDMIERNFSNYSAWHNRSTILSNLMKRKVEGFFPKEKILNDEYDLVHQAIFTDPDDQSGWFYHLWLLKQTVTNNSPWLMSSWPTGGSELTVSANKSTSGSSSCISAEGRIPVVLYFDQPVKGVNSSTVTVKSAFTDSKYLVWQPLSKDKYESAQAWASYLEFSDIHIDYSTPYTVELNLGESPEIISLSGCRLNHAFQSKFLVSFKQSGSSHVEDQDIIPISWKDSNFQKHDTDSEMSTKILPFNHLEMDKGHKLVFSKTLVDILVNEIELFRELLSAIDCKIGKLTLARLLTALDIIKSDDGASNSSQMTHTEEILALYVDLMEMDPPHSQYYKEEHSLALLRQVTCSKDNLLKYCWCYKAPERSDNEDVVCIRLSNLSLARIGSIENLLWVQMLDLSHNKLSSIEGLEAMQLLSYLNLSNNKIGNFTALDPLRYLKSLKSLDISHNEIGKHSIDTTRYLCASPLSHSVASDWKTMISSIGDVRISKYWDAFLVFKDLALNQLEIEGNPIVDEDFGSFLRKVMPTLKWLDGKSL